jgi:methylated-DNA-[protein]-cysteine S-methyltransferase
MKYYYKYMKTPVGKLTLIANDKALCAILWDKDDATRVKVNPDILQNDHPVLVQTEKQIKEYFLGARLKFTIKLDPIGTKFQKQVWSELKNIPYGKTLSYGEIALKIGNPKASRAVGAANGKNPLSIILPCHRVIGSSGKLTGFAGGLDVKSFLLDLESVNLTK